MSKQLPLNPLLDYSQLCGPPLSVTEGWDGDLVETSQGHFPLFFFLKGTFFISGLLAKGAGAGVWGYDSRCYHLRTGTFAIPFCLPLYPPRLPSQLPALLRGRLRQEVPWACSGVCSSWGTAAPAHTAAPYANLWSWPVTSWPRAPKGRNHVASSLPLSRDWAWGESLGWERCSLMSQPSFIHSFT